MQTNDEIKDLVKATIQTKIVQAFNDAPETIDLLVKAALGQEVNQFGAKPSGYGDKRMPYLEYLVGDIIRGAARNAVIEAVKLREEEIKASVQKSISADAIVDGLLQSILGVVDESYKVNIQFVDDSKK